MRRRSRLIAAGLGLGAAGALAAAACALLAERHYLFDIVAQFAAPALTGACVGAVLSAAALRPRIAAAWLVAIAGLLVAMQPQLRPFPPGAGPATRVYFNNVYVMNPRPAQLAASIEDADADVVALVEVGPRHERAAAAVLARYPHRLSAVTGAFQGKTPRILFASRAPLRVLANERRDGLAVTEVEVTAASGPFRLIAVHLTRPWPFDDPRAQDRQAARLARRVMAGDVGRTVLVGDFNAVPAGAVLRRFSRETGLRPLAAPTGTWPAWVPPGFRVGIDNALAGPALSLSDRRVGAVTGSDHRAIVFEVRRAAALPERRLAP